MAAERAPTLPTIPQVERLLQSVLEKMEQLCVLYTQEIDSLSVGDMRKFQEVQPEKLRLVRECELGVAEIGSNKDIIARCNSVLRERVLSTHATLSQLAEISKNSCDSRIRSMKRIQNRLLQAARLMVNKDKKNYGRNGKVEAPHTARPVATAINEAI